MTGSGTGQHRADGTLRHLLTLESLPRTDLERLLERAQGFVRPLGAKPPVSTALAGVTVANLFTEPSTRTRVSFELAAKRLGAEVVNLEVQLSSRVKGESMLDTVCTLLSLHVYVLVIREAEAGVLNLGDFAHRWEISTLGLEVSKCAENGGRFEMLVGGRGF